MIIPLQAGGFAENEARLTIMNLKLSVNILRIIIVLSLLGLAVQTYNFILQLSSDDLFILALPYTFETWFFGNAYVYPAWYPLILMVLAIIGLRFGETRAETRASVAETVRAPVSE